MNKPLPKTEHKTNDKKKLYLQFNSSKCIPQTLTGGADWYCTIVYQIHDIYFISIYMYLLYSSFLKSALYHNRTNSMVFSFLIIAHGFLILWIDFQTRNHTLWCLKAGKWGGGCGVCEVVPMPIFGNLACDLNKFIHLIRITECTYPIYQQIKTSCSWCYKISTANQDEETLTLDPKNHHFKYN